MQESIDQIIKSYLGNQLEDPVFAEQLVPVIKEQVLTWKAPVTDLTNVKAIIAFAFGNRRMDNGNIIPGPMNENLAEVVLKLYHERECAVYAQWEIAESIGTQIPSKDLYPIYPDIHEQNATVKYLNTRGVILKVREMVKDPKSLGKVLIVAYRDHALRCHRIAQEEGFQEAYLPPIELPNEYDPESAQPWTRDRHAYIIYDVLLRLEAYWAKVIGTLSPSS